MKLHRMIATAFLAVFLMGIATPAFAGEIVLGYWKTIDDKTKSKKSIVKIFKKGGKYFGKIIRLFRKPSQDQNPKCTKCTDHRKNKPIIGMQILENLKKAPSKWKGRDWYNKGKILDPNNGKIYGTWISPTNDGKKLLVRGFIGFSLIGRSQTWLRAKKPATKKPAKRKAEKKEEKKPAAR